MKIVFTVSAIFLTLGCLRAQTPLLTDGLMMPRKELGIGLFYGQDRWSNYWEGTLKRDNGNIGKVTTRSVSFMSAYGITDKLTVIALLPYVTTNASRGTLHGMEGLQDLTLAAKYTILKQDFQNSSLKFIVLGAYSFPVTDYTPDFMPMSIGMGCKNFNARFTSTYAYKKWYATGSFSYTFRGNITLDRPSYYTNGHLYNTNEVAMPDAIDFIIRTGYQREKWHAELFYTQQNTLGGGDIERQNMPFASDKMNYGKIGASAMAFVPQIPNLAVRLWGDYTMIGRNVGQSTAIMGGVVYRFNFSKQVPANDQQ